MGHDALCLDGIGEQAHTRHAPPEPRANHFANRYNSIIAVVPDNGTILRNCILTTMTQFQVWKSVKTSTNNVMNERIVPRWCGDEVITMRAVWRLLLVFLVAAARAEKKCPPQEIILPCRCLIKGEDFQIW